MSRTFQTFFNITNLTSGVNYNIKVSAVAADNGTEGSVVGLSNYTKPDTVINLTATEITVSSVFLNWSEPSGARSFFRIIWTNGSQIYNNTTGVTFFNFTNLIPGVNYSFKVSAVASDNSTEGRSFDVFYYTKPDIIQNLIASEITTSSLSLSWTKPTGQSSFFRVYWINGNITAATTFYKISDLTPGSNYTFKVSAVAADNVTEGEIVCLSKCTNTSPVLNYTCIGPNRTDPLLNLTWKNPGNNQGFNISHGSGVYDSTTITCNDFCVHTIYNLQYSKTYDVTITTLGCGQSGRQNFMCSTGITDPPVPSNPVNLTIQPPKTGQKVATIQFSSSLLNGTNGEIKIYGVLLSTDTESNSSTSYLTKTYGDWKQSNTKTYLTVLIQNTVTNTRSEYPVSVEIGNDIAFNGTKYINGPLVNNKQYRVAIVLFTSLQITDGIVDITQSFVSITPFTNTIILIQTTDVVPIVLGILSIVILILIISIVVFIKLKRKSKEQYVDVPVTTLRTKVSIPVRIEDYEIYFKKQQADSNCGFAEEYEDLKVVGTAQPKDTALAMENKGKNRYNNVLPYDSSRVKLSTHGNPFDDYINANYISGYNSKKEYIAAQGPLPATVNEFWRMIWEKHVRTIVMLTRCNEQGRVKCEKYWPSQSMTYSNIKVTNMSEIALEDWTISDFAVKNVKTAESREVRHFHFTAWPDHGVPETTEVLINFRHLVREHMDQYSRNSPTVVHCSAGVGRTGTFIALDHLIFQIERESMVDIFGIVYDMRMHRSLMVQTEDQYVFLNQCALDIIKSRMGTNVDLIYQNAAAFNIYGNL